MRQDLNADFPLRGAILCGDCSNPLTACYSKSKTGAKHAYYMCYKKGCDSYRKSIRRDEVEANFAAMLETLGPRQNLYQLVSAMFKEAWSRQLDRAAQAKASLQKQLDKVERSISQFLDRIVETDNPRVIATYETKIDELERSKLVLTEKLAKTGKPAMPFGDVFELTLKFIANPSILWVNGNLHSRRSALKLCFTEAPIYDRNEGFRTPKTSMIFKVLDTMTGIKQETGETKGLFAVLIPAGPSALRLMSFLG